MKRHVIGFSLITLSWISWVLIINVPLSHLGIKSIWIALAILFIASCIFWVGVFLLGKGLAQKYRILPKTKNRLNLKPGSMVRIS